MGYMKHHAIVVTGWEYGQVEEALSKSIELDMTTTPIVESPVNAYWSFMICPDGSKEGWGASDEGDMQRTAFIEWLDEIERGHGMRKRYALAWAEVIYGDENGPARIERAA